MAARRESVNTDCVAATPHGRCLKTGTVPVTTPIVGKVCANHHHSGWLPHQDRGAVVACKDVSVDTLLRADAVVHDNVVEHIFERLMRNARSLKEHPTNATFTQAFQLAEDFLKLDRIAVTLKQLPKDWK